jgi:hypothetical protein
MAAENYSTGEGPSSVTSADFDGDGYEDVATANDWNHNVSILLNRSQVGIEEAQVLTRRKLLGYRLAPCVPNPFQHRTKIRYSILDTRCLIPKPIMQIYDASGRLVKSFNLESSVQNIESEVIWDGRDDSHRKLPSGVYFLEFSAGDFSATEKMLLIR